MVTTITFSIEEKIAERVEKIATDTKRTRSSVIVQLLEIALGLWETGELKESIIQSPTMTEARVIEIIDAQFKKTLLTMDDEAKNTLFDYLKKKGGQE